MRTGVIFISSETKREKGVRILQEARDQEAGDDGNAEST